MVGLLPNWPTKAGPSYGSLLSPSESTSPSVVTGVELTCGNGYLLDQFLQTNSNQRMDEYGSSIENRLRFSSEVLDVVTGAISPQRTSIRISPW